MPGAGHTQSVVASWCSGHCLFVLANIGLGYKIIQNNDLKSDPLFKGLRSSGNRKSGSFAVHAGTSSSFLNDHHHHKSTSAAPSLRKDGPPATRRTKAQGRGLLVYPRPVSNTGPRSWHLAVLRERARARARARLPRPAARARSLTMGCGGSKGKKGTAVQEQKEEPPKTKGACVATTLPRNNRFNKTISPGLCAHTRGGRSRARLRIVLCAHRQHPAAARRCHRLSQRGTALALLLLRLRVGCCTSASGHGRVWSAPFCQDGSARPPHTHTRTRTRARTRARSRARTHFASTRPSVERAVLPRRVGNRHCRGGRALATPRARWP